MKTRLAGFVAALTACAALGDAPTQAADPPESIGNRPEITYLAQFYWPGYGYHATTPAGSYALGAAAMTRARGQYNLLTARASVAAAEAMLAELKRRITRVHQMDYIAAKRFIQSLAYEVRRPTS